MTMTILDDYRRTHDDLPTLGRIGWYSVHEGTVPHGLVAAQFDAVGLKTYTPTWPAASDQFRRVTKAAETTLDLDDDRKAKILVRDVTTDKDRILRKMVVETVDAAGARLDYTEVYDLEYRKATKQLVTTPHTWSATVADPLIPELQNEYAAAVAGGYINAEGLRAAVKRALEDNNAIPVRPTGGVYFVPRINVDTLDSLERLAASIETVKIHSLPLLDEPGQPEMVAGAITDASVKKADELSRDLAQMLAEEAEVSEAKLARITGTYKGLRSRLADYRDLLGTDLASVDVRLDMLDRQVQAAMFKVAARGAA